MAAEHARTDQVPVEGKIPFISLLAQQRPSTAPTLAAPRVVSYPVYLREHMKRGR